MINITKESEYTNPGTHIQKPNNKIKKMINRTKASDHGTRPDEVKKQCLSSNQTRSHRRITNKILPLFQTKTQQNPKSSSFLNKNLESSSFSKKKSKKSLIFEQNLESSSFSNKTPTKPRKHKSRKMKIYGSMQREKEKKCWHRWNIG